MIAGWFMTCKNKGYNVICLNYLETYAGPFPAPAADPAEDYCLYVDEEKGEVMWYTA